MTRTKRAFEDLLGGAGPVPSRDPANTREEMRGWFDDQPPRHALAGRFRQDGAAARGLGRSVAAQPAFLAMSTAQLRQLTDRRG
jgi:hypothetical protein